MIKDRRLVSATEYGWSAEVIRWPEQNGTITLDTTTIGAPGTYEDQATAQKWAEETVAGELSQGIPETRVIAYVRYGELSGELKPGKVHPPETVTVSTCYAFEDNAFRWSTPAEKKLPVYAGP